MGIKKIIDVVQKVLSRDITSRSSDWVLYNGVCKEMGLKTDSISVEDMCLSQGKFPSFESVTRARRKWQEMGCYPPTDEVKRLRRKNEIEYLKEMRK